MIAANLAIQPDQMPKPGRAMGDLLRSQALEQQAAQAQHTGATGRVAPSHDDQESMAEEERALKMAMEASMREVEDSRLQELTGSAVDSTAQPPHCSHLTPHPATRLPCSHQQLP